MLKQISVAFMGAIACSLASIAPGFAQIEYTKDGFYDGVTDGQVGNQVTPGFELFGTGYKQEGSSLIIGISSNMPFGGYSSSAAEDGHIRWGDLFFNFSDKDFETAIADGDVYGVRFDPLNNSGVAKPGIYQVTSTKSVTGQNSGFNSLNQYINRVNNANHDPYLGEQNLNDQTFSYLNQQKSDNVIAAGTLLSEDVEYLSNISSYGFDFENNLEQSGAYSHGIRFDLSHLPGGDFVAHFFAECLNEGTAFEGTVESVPEPMSALAVAVFGIVIWAGKHQLKA